MPREDCQGEPNGHAGHLAFEYCLQHAAQTRPDSVCVGVCTRRHTAGLQRIMVQRTEWVTGQFRGRLGLAASRSSLHLVTLLLRDSSSSAQALG